MEKSIKKASDNDLSELLDLLGQLFNRIRDYRHIEEHTTVIEKQITDLQTKAYKECEKRGF